MHSDAFADSSVDRGRRQTILEMCIHERKAGLQVVITSHEFPLVSLLEKTPGAALGTSSQTILDPHLSGAGPYMNLHAFKSRTAP